MKFCPQCQHPDPAPVWNTEEQLTKGWFCKACGHFEKAVGREKKLPLEVKNEKPDA